MTLAGIGVGWPVGWAIGAVVVLLAAVLLIVAILQARQIARQADDITDALDGARENTGSLFDVARTNLAVDQITRDLRRVREARSP